MDLGDHCLQCAESVYEFFRCILGRMNRTDLDVLSVLWNINWKKKMKWKECQDKVKGTEELSFNHSFEWAENLYSNAMKDNRNINGHVGFHPALQCRKNFYR